MNVMRLRQTLQTRVVTLYLQTVSVTSLICSKQLRSSRTFSSATRQEQRLTPKRLTNFHNAFASIYEGRYLAGIAAGMKLNEMIAKRRLSRPDQAKIGYVGAYTYAEVMSGYTSFFLGARSVCPSATMEVQFTGSWYDEALEKEAATKLISNGCKLISQHADSMGAPTACENAGIPNVSYNGSTLSACPNTFIVSSRIDWAPYYEFAINSVIDGDRNSLRLVQGYR